MRILYYFIFFIFFSGCSSHPILFKQTRILMDTFAEISCYSTDKSSALKAMDVAFNEMERIEKVFSKYDEDSELSRINRFAGEREVEVNREVFELIESSIYYSEISEGSFDITLQNRGYRSIILNKESFSVKFANPEIKIDLGGIAKGYAVDRAKDVLQNYGIKRALVDIGGNIFALGSPPNKKAWRVGIQDPRAKTRVIHKLDLKDKAVSTSGNYERPQHIINPITGIPAQELLSVTVIASSAEKADALSTAVFVMGMEKGLRFIKTLEDVEVFIFDKDAKLVKYP